MFLYVMVVMALWTGFWLFSLFFYWQWQPLPRNIPSFPALLDDIYFPCCKTLPITFIMFAVVAGMWLFQSFNFLLGEFLQMRLSRPRLLPRIRFSRTKVVFSRYFQQLHGLCELHFVLGFFCHCAPQVRLFSLGVQLGI